MVIDRTDIKQANLEHLARLAAYLEVLPTTFARPELEACVARALGVDMTEHVCKFHPVGGMGAYLICWGCGEVKDA